MRPRLVYTCYTLVHNAINPWGLGAEPPYKIRPDPFLSFSFLTAPAGNLISLTPTPRCDELADLWPLQWSSTRSGVAPRRQDLGSHQAKQLKIYEIVDMKGAYRGQYGIF